jgi:XPG domain containing
VAPKTKLSIPFYRIFALSVVPAMGISGLQALLQPYAENVSYPATYSISGCPGIPDDSESAAEQPSMSSFVSVAVIDAPSLAYHVYAISNIKLLHQQGNASSARRYFSAATPSYAAIGAAFIAWLDALKVFGFSVGALYFDAALPTRKRPIRLQRTNARAKELRTCRSAYPTDAELVPKRARTRSNLSDDVDVENCRQVRSATHGQHLAADSQFRQRGGATAACKMKSGIHSTPHSAAEPSFSLEDLFNRVYPRSAGDFPPPPFLVTSVVEALRQHEEYAAKTWLVPGEADPYCAAYARLHGATIFTADSDSLAFDLGPRGAVMLLGNLSIGGLDDVGSRRLLGKIYHLGKIARRFGLRNLTPLAYAVSRDRFKSLTQLLDVAKQFEKNPSRDYQQFWDEYVPQNFPKSDVTQPLGQALQHIDTPLSEWVHNGLDALRNDDPALIDIWLPVLIDDASRTAPWSYGADVRRLAYSIIRPRQNQLSCTSEHMRKGLEITEVRVHHVENTQLLKELATFHDLIVSSISMLSNGARPQWRELGLLWLCRSLVESGKDVPTRKDLELTFTGNVCHSWALIHLFAQFQAILYSWRILLQNLKMYFVFDFVADTYQDSAKSLLTFLEPIDGALLTTMFDPLPDETVDQNRLDFVIGRIFEEFNIQETIQPLGEQPNTKKKKRKKSKPSQKLISPSDPKNRFSLLAAMNE